MTKCSIIKNAQKIPLYCHFNKEAIITTGPDKIIDIHIDKAKENLYFSRTEICLLPHTLTSPDFAAAAMIQYIITAGSGPRRKTGDITLHRTNKTQKMSAFIVHSPKMYIIIFFILFNIVLWTPLVL